MQRDFKGLICQTQAPTNLSEPYWKYGRIVDGIRHVDPLMHFGCFTLGYDRHDIVDYVASNLKIVKPDVAESMLPENLYLDSPAYDLADQLYKITNGYKSFFSLSGSDANEGAIKLASAYHKLKGQDRKTIISFEGAYHGSTFLNINLGQSYMLDDPFYTMNRYDAVKNIPIDFNIDSVNWNDVICIVVETCQHNLIKYSDEFWQKLNYIRDVYGVLIVIDDIWIGSGKTGTYVGWQNENIVPDIFTMGKGITGGFFQLSVTLYNEKVSSVIPKDFIWCHGFTYSFPLPGILSALKYLDILEQENVLDKHQTILNNTKQAIDDIGGFIKRSYGTHFILGKDEYAMLYMVPLNANDEYFDALKNHVEMWSK